MRIRILMRLFMNSNQEVYLRGLVDEFGASPGQISEELKHLAQAGLLQKTRNGRQVFYRANTLHTLYPELQSMVKKALGMDHIIESILQRVGKLDQAFLIDDYAIGKDSGLVDLVLVGEIDRNNLDDLVGKAEKYIKRKIRTLVVSREEYREMEPVLAGRPRLYLWGPAADNADAGDKS